MSSQNPLSRQQVYEIIDGELTYAYAKHGDHYHSPIEWIVFATDYLTEANHIASRSNDEADKLVVMSNIRKAAGLLITAMEQNGVPPRVADSDIPVVYPENDA